MEKHSVVILGHATSLSMESEFWSVLRFIAAQRGESVAGLIRQIDYSRRGNLSSAVRVFILKELQKIIQDNQSQGDAIHGENSERGAL